jgi:hypothetical protein
MLVLVVDDLGSQWSRKYASIHPPPANPTSTSISGGGGKVFLSRLSLLPMAQLIGLDSVGVGCSAAKDSAADNQLQLRSYNNIPMVDMI